MDPKKCFHLPLRSSVSSSFHLTSFTPDSHFMLLDFILLFEPFPQSMSNGFKQAINNSHCPQHLLLILRLCLSYSVIIQP